MPCTTSKHIFNRVKNHLTDHYQFNVFFFLVSRFYEAIDLLVDFREIGPKPSKFLSAALGLNLEFPNDKKIGRLVNSPVTRQ